jgi:hypothetical protein
MVYVFNQRRTSIFFDKIFLTPLEGVEVSEENWKELVGLYPDLTKWQEEGELAVLDSKKDSKEIKKRLLEYELMANSKPNPAGRESMAQYFARNKRILQNAL